MSGQRYTVAFMLVGLLASSTLAAPVLADVEWEKDGWLTTALADERLTLGDEFGCYGMPGYSWFNDPGAVAKECRSYIENNTDASKWGENALSTYVPSGLTMAQHNYIKSQDFVVHGDNTGLNDTVWHTSTDVPNDTWDWFNLEILFVLLLKKVVWSICIGLAESMMQRFVMILMLSITWKMMLKLG